MILVDVNLLVYAVNRDSPFHAKAHEWWIANLNGLDRIGIPWESLTGFVRIASHPRITPRCITVTEAWKIAQTWLDRPNVSVPQPAPDHRVVFQRLVCAVPMTHKLVADAHLAAIAISHRLTLCSADTGFAQFPGLSFLNPLA